jgi:hypothetical protein
MVMSESAVRVVCMLLTGQELKKKEEESYICSSRLAAYRAD